MNIIYKRISSEDAKNIIDKNPNAIILDTRTEEEYVEGHIENSILIPDYEMEKRASYELPDKNALILIYCRSGNRSKVVANILIEMGYTNVYDFGGINTWPYKIIFGKA